MVGLVMVGLGMVGLGMVGPCPGQSGRLALDAACSMRQAAGMAKSVKRSVVRQVLRSGARTDVGRVRRNNQDAYHAGQWLAAVADGMGGMAAGDVASRLAIEALAPLDREFTAREAVPALRRAVADATRRIHDEIDADPTKQGMGTTLTAVLSAGDQIALIHIGDSRAYLLGESGFEQLTRDDTYVQMLVDDGRITLEEASSHPQRSVVSQVLQGQPADPAFTLRPAHPGDRYLLCSDGLSGVISAQTIEEVLREYADVAECADRLVVLAVEAGGPDNVTAVVCDVTADADDTADAVPTDAVPTDAVPASAVPASAVPASAVPASAVPASTVPGDAEHVARLEAVDTPPAAPDMDGDRPEASLGARLRRWLRRDASTRA